MSIPTGVLFGLGNPLLDISVDAEDELFTKYALSHPNAILAEESHLPLYEEITTEPFVPEYVAGGSSQNTTRVTQWMLQSEGATIYTGCVGKDANAQTLRDCAAKDGVLVPYSVSEKSDTGLCAVLIKNKDRSMVTNLQAANEFHVDYLATPEVEKLWTNAQYYFVEGYFLTVSQDSVVKLAEHATANGKTFGFSLSAPFICQFFAEGVKAVLKSTQVVFANETEAETLGDTLGLEDKSISNLGVEIRKLMPENAIVVITCGADNVHVFNADGEQAFPVPKMELDEMVDTNGAGDAFAGGFMAGLIKKASFEKCANAGTYAAQTIIRTSGTKLSGVPTFEW